MRVTIPILSLLVSATSPSALSMAVAFTITPPALHSHSSIQRRGITTKYSNRSVPPDTATRCIIALYQQKAKSVGNDVEDDSGGSEEDGQRRKTIFGGAVASSLPFFFGGNKSSRKANAATTTTGMQGDASTLIADFPMRRLRLPKGGMGREYIIIQLYIEGKGPYDFMVDSGLTTELITPHLQQVLNLNKSSGITKQGLSAGATSQTQSIIELNDVSLCCGKFASGESFFPIPGTLHAIVTDFPQEHMDPAHDPVEGMIGMEVLEQFDVDFDFPAGRLRLWKAHSIESVAKKAGLKTIDAVVVNETRLLGFRVVSASAPRDSSGYLASQPFLGVVDCGSSFTVVNWAAAPFLGLPPQNDGVYKKSPMVAGLGVDGKPQLMPTTNIGLSYCGYPKKDRTSTMAFEAAPKDWKPWDRISVAVGDLPVFSQLLGDGRTPYRGPAGIIGLDILSQRRLILETSNSRRRRIFVG